MSSIPRRLVLGAVTALVLTSLVAPAALAAAPTRTVDELHLVNEFPAGTRCPFDVVRTVDGTLVTTTFVDAAGLTTTTYSYKGGKIEYTNPANGRSISTVLAGPAVYVDNGDGTTTVSIPGNSQLYTAAGIGFVVGNAGLSVVTIDTVTGEILSTDKLAGHQDGLTFPSFCVGIA
jgi:uncharacterized membrane protein